MTANVVYLPPCAALPILLIRELFGFATLSWRSDSGVELSDEMVSAEINGTRYNLPVLKNDYVSPKLFLNLNFLQKINHSLYSRQEGVDISISGPGGTFTRDCELFNIAPVVWIPGNEKFSECVGKVSVETQTSTHIFNSISLVRASIHRSSLILPENWLQFTGNQPNVLLDSYSSPLESDHLVFNRIITENDIRVARRKNQTIKLDSSSRMTPAAKDLGTYLKIFR